MTDKLPPNLLQLFAPRPPLGYAPPLDSEDEGSHTYKLDGVAQFVHLLKNYDPDYVPTETLGEKKKRLLKEKIEKHQAYIEEKLQEWKNRKDENVKGDPLKTIVVARLSYDVDEAELKKIFEYYGPIKHLKMINDKQGKPRGYAFIEYEHEGDMEAAFHEADAMKIKGRRIVVDVERGRTVKDWKPRRLGGGLGGTRRGTEIENQHHSGREIASKRSELGTSSRTKESRPHLPAERRDHRRDDRNRRESTHSSRREHNSSRKRPRSSVKYSSKNDGNNRENRDFRRKAY